MNTHDIAMQGYKDEWAPTETPKNHWSNSPQWLAYLKAKADAQLPAYGGAPFSGPATRVERETPEMAAAYAAFVAVYPPVESTPAPTRALTARDAELQAAQIDLRRAVGRMRIFASPLALVDLVQRMVNE